MDALSELASQLATKIKLPLSKEFKTMSDKQKYQSIELHVAYFPLQNVLTSN